MKIAISFILLSLFLLQNFLAASQVSGYVNLPKDWGSNIYLSLVDDYRDMTLMTSSDLVATTSIDSNGYFEFPQKYFSDEMELYKVHVSTTENELEEYYADLAVDGVGYNYFIFEASKTTRIDFVLNNQNEHIFNPSDPAAHAWLTLDSLQQIYYSEIYFSGESAEDLFIRKFHTNVMDYVRDKSVITQLMACFYLLRIDANLDVAYRRAIIENRAFFDDLLTKKMTDGHKERLRIEMNMIFKEIDAETILQLKKENQFLSFGLIGFVILSGVLVFMLFLTKKESKKSKHIRIELTPQEEKILALIKAGKSNQEIADALFISLSTVKTHVNSIYKKKEVRTRKALMDA